MNEDRCIELVLSRDPQDSNWLPMTPETGTLASPERAAAAVQAFKPWRSVLGDSHIAFAQLKRLSHSSNILNLTFNLKERSQALFDTRVVGMPNRHRVQHAPQPGLNLRCSGQVAGL